jgi:ribosomal protein L16/L10AE
MLMPKRVKRRRVHRGRMTGKATAETRLPTDSMDCRRWIPVGLPATRLKLPVLP